MKPYTKCLSLFKKLKVNHKYRIGLAHKGQDKPIKYKDVLVQAKKEHMPYVSYSIACINLHDNGFLYEWIAPEWNMNHCLHIISVEELKK